MAVTKVYSLFSYKRGNSFLHKCPAWIKIIFIPIINIIFLCLPAWISCFLILAQFILATVLHFTFREQFEDLKPVFFYAVIVILMQFLLWIFGGLTIPFKEYFSWESQKENVYMIVKIFAVMQTASLIFKTSTSLEMRDGIAKIFGYKSAITYALFMFLNFIPMVGILWTQSKRAWFARGGKHNVKMYLVLLPVLFSVGLKKAWNTSRAVYIREV